MLTGGCLCGGVHYEVTETPVAAGYCHCTRCQRRTGSAAACSAMVVPGSLRVTSGEELLASWDPPDGWSKVFCSACGGALWATNGEIHAVRMGTFDGDPGVRPSYRQFVAYAAPWEPVPDDGLTRHPERRPPLLMPVHVTAPTVVPGVGAKVIRELVGNVNTGTAELSVARMTSPPGWEEPAQTPEFDEVTVVLEGSVMVEHDGGTITVLPGEAVLARAGEHVRYSTPEGAEYIAICVPAFSPDAAHRD